MKNKKLSFFVSVSFCLGLIVLILPVASSGQGKYVGQYSKRDVSNIIANLENSSNKFRRDFDRYLDDSPINGSNEEDRINQVVEDYERALNSLRRNFNNSNNWWQSRNDVQGVMDEAREVNLMMNNLSFARRLERQWKNMRRDINKLADTYDLAELDRDDDDGDNTGGGGDVPKWAIGTFYGRNPQTGGTIVLSINRNGSVAINADGVSTAYATMRGDRLNNNGIIARVTRLDNGIRTTRLDNGERIDYFLNGNDNGGNSSSGGGNVPNWAIGTFYGRNPQTGGTITLSISNNGSVVIRFENGSTTYATLNGDRLDNNGIVSRVTKINNGIRTTRLDNGERIDYRR